jgi:class 3 adenylate cyclase/tetratricopeptide (TPR) repeat protein
VISRRVVSVLFADLVGFTALAERHDAEDIATVQAAYFNAVRDVVGRYGGLVEKFVGDAAMAVFGVPETRDDDAERAVRAALALTRAVDGLSSALGLEGAALAVRVGVNTGEVVYHESRAPDSPLVTGDTVNVASRLESAAPAGRVLVAEPTALAVVDAVELEPAFSVVLKGKQRPAIVRLVIGVRSERSREHAMGELRAPLVGRESELRTLHDAWRQGGVAIVVAPPGTGKSRLTREFGRTVPIAWCAQVKRDAPAAFEPIRQLFLSALQGEAIDGMAQLQRRLSRTLPAERAQFVTSEVAALVESRASTSRDRSVIFDAWATAFEALAGARRTTWIVEDVHWAASDLLAVLSLVGERPRQFVLTTARPRVLDQEPAWCAAATVVHLDPLEEPAVSELVTALVGDALPERAVREMTEVSGGNPLFVEELLRTWISLGVIERRSGTWRLTTQSTSVDLPLTVQAAYIAQIDDLPVQAREVVRRGSVIGRRFYGRALAALGISESDATAGIRVLTQRALIAPTSTEPRHDDSYAFRHTLLVDTAYSMLARAERAQLHFTYATWLAGSANDQSSMDIAEVIADHFAAALANTLPLGRMPGRTRQDVAALAAGWYERAARGALGDAAHASARALVGRSLDLTPDDAARERARRLELLGDATATVANVEEAAAVYAEAGELYRRLQDDAGLARSAAGRGRTMCAQFQFEAAIELAERELEHVASDPLARAPLVLLAAHARAYLGRVDASDEHAVDQVLELARSLNDQELELDALSARAHMLSESGVANRETWGELHRTAVARAHWELSMDALRMQAAQTWDQSPSAALDLLKQAEQAGLTRHLTEKLAWTHFARAEILFAIGEWDDATDAGEEALALAQGHAYNRAAVRTWFVLVPIAAAREDDVLMARARAWWTEHVRDTPSSDYGRLMTSSVDSLLGRRVRVPDDQLATAFRSAESSPSWLAAADTIVTHWLEARQTNVVHQALERLDDELGEEPQSQTAAAAVARMLHARLALAEEDHTRARADAERALAIVRSIPMPWWQAKAIHLLRQTGAVSSTLSAELGAIERRLQLSADALASGG